MGIKRAAKEQIIAKGLIVFVDYVKSQVIYQDHLIAKEKEKANKERILDRPIIPVKH